MTDAYFTTNDDSWFEPTDYARGPWDPNACHGGPPTALLVRAVEGLAPGQRLVRVAVDLRRPIPMSGFRVQGEVRRPGRSVTYTEAEIFDEDHIYARAYAMHIRTLDRFDVSTADVSVPRFEDSVPGTFFVDALVHDLGGFPDSRGQVRPGRRSRHRGSKDNVDEDKGCHHRWRGTDTLSEDQPAW